MDASFRFSDLESFPVLSRAKDAGFFSCCVIAQSSTALLSVIGFGVLLHGMVQYQAQEAWKQASWSKFPSLTACLDQIKEVMPSDGNVFIERNFQAMNREMWQIAQQVALSELQRYQTDLNDFWPLLDKLCTALDFSPLVLRMSHGQFFQHQFVPARKGMVLVLSFEPTDVLIAIATDFSFQITPEQELKFPYIVQTAYKTVSGFVYSGPIAQSPATTELLKCSLSVIALLKDQISASPEGMKLLKVAKRYLKSTMDDEMHVLLREVVGSEGRHPLRMCETFRGGELVLGECNHSFHKECLDREQVTTCPTCEHYQDHEKCSCCDRMRSRRIIMSHACTASVCAKCLVVGFCPQCNAPLADREKNWVVKRTTLR